MTWVKLYHIHQIEINWRQECHWNFFCFTFETCRYFTSVFATKKIYLQFRKLTSKPN